MCKPKKGGVGGVCGGGGYINEVPALMSSCYFTQILIGGKYVGTKQGTASAAWTAIWCDANGTALELMCVTVITSPFA